MEAPTPTMVLLHGWCCSAADMGALADELARDHRVLAVDLPGHGDSAMPWAGRTLGDLAREVAGIGVGPMLLVGHSMGGAVAVQAAASHPERVVGVVAVDAPWILARPEPAKVALAGEPWGPSYRERVDRLVAARAALLPSVPVGAPAPDVAVGSYAALMAWDGPAATAAVTCPLVLVAAEANLVATRADAAAHPQVRVVETTGTGHWVQVERPAEVASVVRRLAAELVGEAA
jgi:pimeloyl-ACP methyl ester carboxylesterase